MLKFDLKEWKERLNDYEDQSLFGTRDDLEGYLSSCRMDKNNKEYDRADKYLNIVWDALRERNLV